MVTMVKALRILENKATTTLHLDPPTRTLAAKVLHSLTYECSTKVITDVSHDDCLYYLSHIIDRAD